MPKPEEAPFDPLFLNARREAWLILLSWAVCLVWTIGYSALTGYDVPVDEVTYILGIPGWVFWGILVPWILATGFSIWFGLVYIADDDLGDEHTSAE
jgi:hypothetical protein